MLEHLVMYLLVICIKIPIVQEVSFWGSSLCHWNLIVYPQAKTSAASCKHCNIATGTLNLALTLGSFNPDRNAQWCASMARTVAQ